MLLALEPARSGSNGYGLGRTFRNNQFVALNDGSTNNNLQVVFELGKFDEEFLKKNNNQCFIKNYRQPGCISGKRTKAGTKSN